MTQGAEPIIRRFKETDFSSLRDLWAAVHGSYRSEDYDRWRFLSHPIAPIWTSLAMEGERCIGSYTLCPVELNLGGTSVLGAQSLDTMTHPDARGRGLFVKLARHCYAEAAADGCRIVYGFPNENSYPGFIRRLNFHDMGRLGRWTRPLGRATTGSRLAVLGSLAARLLPKGRASAALLTGEGRPAGDELDTLVARVIPHRDICRVGRASYWFDYRYSPASGWDYRWMTARDRAGSLTGVALWRVDPADQRGFLLELIGDAAAKAHLLHSLLTQAATVGMVALSAYGDDPDVVAALKAAGFVKRPGSRLIVRNFDSTTYPGNPHAATAWRFMTGDFDTV